MDQSFRTESSSVSAHALCHTHTSLYTLCVSLVWQLSQGNNSVETDGRTEPKHVRPETAGKAKHASLPRLQNLPTTVRPLRNKATFNLVTVRHISKSPFLFYPSSEGSRGELGVASGMFRTVTIN